jgi:MFS family permease
VGRLTDRFGVRAVLSSEALITIGACALYALAPELLPPGPALLVVSACYIFDQASDAVGMTRAVYVKKICLDPADVSPTLSLGLSIDHVVSMTVPMLGGIAWRSSGGHGYRWIFLTGAVVAALNFLLTKGIRIDGDLSRPGGAAHADRPYS